VVLDHSQGGFELQAVRLQSVTEEGMSLQVAACSLRTLICEGRAPVHVCIGRDLLSGDKILALSDVNSSLVSIVEDHVLHRWKHDNTLGEETTATDSAKLHLFLARSVAEHLLRGLKGLTWIHGAPDDLSKTIDAIPRERGLAVFQTTSNMARTSDVNFIHPYASKDDLQNIRPKGLQSFINLTRSQHGTLSSLIGASLPVSAVMTKDVEDLTVDLSLHTLRSLAKQHLHSGEQVLAESAQIFAVDKVSTVSKELSPTAILDWSTTDSLNTVVRPLEHRGLFAPDKTYLLCGMTSDLGISV
jgi:hypothetical protein